MEEVCKELDEAKAEIKKLQEEYQIKAVLSDSFKKALNEQLLKFQEIKQQVEKQSQELIAKSEELSEARQMLDDLKSGLHKKESSLRHLDLANEKLRAECGEKLHKLEGDKRELILALDEAMGQKTELEKKLSASYEESVGLKQVLLAAEKKCLEVEQKAHASKALKQRDDMILKLEEDNRNVQGQLKWKTEQFKHLEEAHKQFQDRFFSTEEEWERGKSRMLEDICSLQTSLDSQTRISNSLQTQLEMCNQALAHQESRRKLLEVQVSEYEMHCKNECQENKSETESLIYQRDEEIAGLRNSLGNKETLIKDLEFRIAHLEQENQELTESLNDLHESQTKNAAAVSLLTDLRREFRGLEQVHSNCSINLKATESEWSSQMKKMKGDITGYASELKGKEKQLHELHKQLDNFHFTDRVFNEEISILLMILKSELSEACSKLLNAKAEVELCNKEKEDQISLLIEQLQMKNSALTKAQLCFDLEHEKVATLMKRVESLGHTEQQLVEELERHKKLLKESSECQLHLKEQVLQMENALKEDRNKILETLEEAELGLAEKIREGIQLQVELQNRKSNAESLKVCLGETEDVCTQIETSLLLQAETWQKLEQEKECLVGIFKEQDENMDNIRKNILSQQATITKVESLIKDQENLVQISEENDSYIGTIHKDISWLMEDSIRRVSEVEVQAKLDAEKTFQEEERLLKVWNKKEQSIKDLQVLTMSMEKDLESAITSTFSETSEIRAEINALSGALNTFKHKRNLEIEEKNKVIIELKKEASGLCQKLAYKEESLLHAKQVADQLQAELKAKEVETEKLMNQLMDENRSMGALVKELESEKGVLIQDIMKLSAEREDTVVLIEELYDQLSDIICMDVELLTISKKKLQCFKEETGVLDLNGNSRSPLKDLNN